MGSEVLILFLDFITYIPDTYFFVKKKIKHMTINIMTTQGIFHCTVTTIGSLVPVQSRQANAVG